MRPLASAITKTQPPIPAMGKTRFNFWLALTALSWLCWCSHDETRGGGFENLRLVPETSAAKEHLKLVFGIYAALG